MTHRALEPWLSWLILRWKSSRSLLVDCHREWLHAHSLTRGVGARITRLRLNGCQVMCTLWKSVRWGGAGLRSKTLPQRLGECYDVTGGLGCFQTSKRDPRQGGFDGLLLWGVYHEMMANFLLFSAFAGFVTSVLMFKISVTLFSLIFVFNPYCSL